MMLVKKRVSFAIGFTILFVVYHFPEFFQSFWITAIFKIGFLVVALLIARAQGWKWLEGFGLKTATNWYLHLSVGMLIGFVIFVGSILISVWQGAEQIEKIEPFSFFTFHLAPLLLMTFFPSIAEDILTRGYLYGHLKKLNPIIWILISATVYVLNHIWRLDDGIAVIAYLFLLGLVLGFCVILKKSLWLAFGIHWGANLAFELSTTGLKIKELNNSNESTWYLAATWAFLLIVLIIGNFIELSKKKKTV